MITDLMLIKQLMKKNCCMISYYPLICIIHYVCTLAAFVSYPKLEKNN